MQIARFREVDARGRGQGLARLCALTLCVVDPEHSVFFDYYRTGDATLRCDRASAIEGIGRPRVVPSFVPEVVDWMLREPDAAPSERHEASRRAQSAVQVGERPGVPRPL